MLGAAVGGSLLGNLGDRIGRARAMGVSILFYSVFAGLGAFVQTCEQMLVLRFLVGLGVGGMWPNGVALVAECWPNTSRPTVSGILGAGINVGIVCLSHSRQLLHNHARFVALDFQPGRDSRRAGCARADTAAGVAQMAGLARRCDEAAPRISHSVSRRAAPADADRHSARVGAAGRRLGRQQVDDPLGR